MATVILSGALNAIDGVTITAPTGSTRLDTYLLANQNIAISIPTGDTRNRVNLTANGDTGSNTDQVWRMTNSTSTEVTGTLLTSYNAGLDSSEYTLYAGTETFAYVNDFNTYVLSTETRRIPKAPSRTNFSYSYDIGAATSYTLAGTNQSDTLTGGANGDTLIGNEGNDFLKGAGGNDTLNGGLGIDRFIFTNQGTDTITSFTAGTGTNRDVFQITKIDYGITTLSAAQIATPANGRSQNQILVGTTSQLNNVTSGAARFAYNTTINQLLFDNDNNGNFNNGLITVANVTSLSGTLANANFQFI